MIIDRPAPSHISQLWSLWREAFGDSGEFLDAFFTHAFSPERCRCALDDGKVIAAVYWFDCKLRGNKIAYLYALATAIEHRGRGVARKLMEQVHALMEQQGYKGVILVPGEKDLFSFYKAIGYSTCTQIAEFVCAGAADEVQLRKVTAEEYAQQRRNILSLLEEGGVLQEQENLAFLASQAEFYIGQNVLLAARREGDMLVGIELLGDPQRAPGIVQALGYARGRFRTRGPGRDFTMYCPLGSSTLAAPTYFGLAFD